MPSDPLTGLLSDSDQTLVTEYLGREVPVSTRGQTTLPVGGAPVTGGAGPVAPGGTGVSAAPVGATPGGPPSASKPSDVPGLAKLGVGVAEKLQRMFGGPGSTPQTVPSSELLGDAPPGAPVFDVPSRGVAPAPNVPSDVGAFAETGAEASSELTAAGTTPETFSAGTAPDASLLGDLALSVAAVGEGINIAQRAGGKEPAGQQAAKAAVETASIAAAPATFGFSALAPLVVGEIAGSGFPVHKVDPIFGYAIEEIYGPPGGSYIKTRTQAGKGATEGLKDFGNMLTEGAKSADPADALKSLQGTGPVRASVQLQPEVAQQLGITSAEFAEMKPEQFNRLLDWYAEDPSRIAASISGSGDVPYLPGHQAKQVADQAATGAQQLMTFLVNRKIVQEAMQAAQPAAAPASAPVAAPPVTPAGGGPLGLAEIGLEVGQ